MKKIFIFISLFLMFSSLSYIFLSYEKDTEIQEYLSTKTKQYLQNYKILYDEHKTLSHMIFTTRINTKKVLDIFEKATLYSDERKDIAREELHKHLENTYKLLKTFNIKQLHFHLPNNDSFLRFHRPLKFGDNLTDIRSTVRYVNKFKEEVDGFEEGRIYNGYRFVYPLFKGKRYLGSVEISFSTFAMNLEFMHGYDVISNFLILKNVVDKKVFKEEQNNYVSSMIKGFCLEKAMLLSIEKERNIKTNEPLSQKTKEILEYKGLSNNSFSLYDEIRKDVMTFIKVKNPVTNKVVGLFVIRSSANYIFNKNKNFYIGLILINLFIGLALFFIYKEINYRKKIELSNKELYDSRLEVLSLNQTLEARVKEEVLKNIKKDKQMLQQSRLAQMGEMISMIAHQWRQPLAAISATSIDMQMKIELETFDLSKVEERAVFFKNFNTGLNNIDGFVQSLTTTIDDFRNFYKPSKEKSLVSINTAINRALKIVKSTLLVDNIELVEKYESNKKIDIHINEIVQVILNIIKNSQDNFREKSIKNAKIFIHTQDIDRGLLLEIFDNGGGIPDSIIEEIFDPYFSTKDEKNGSGLGLYMSKMIVEEHHNGIMSVINTKDGVCFKIEINENLLCSQD